MVQYANDGTCQKYCIEHVWTIRVKQAKRRFECEGDDVLNGYTDRVFVKKQRIGDVDDDNINVVSIVNDVDSEFENMIKSESDECKDVVIFGRKEFCDENQRQTNEMYWNSSAQHVIGFVFSDN